MSANIDEWKVIRSEEGPSLKLFNARFDLVRNPVNGKEVRVVILDSPDSVNVIAQIPNGKMLMVRQYRFGIGEMTLELPGGIVDEGEAHGDAAQRELREETGYTGSDWQYLGATPSNPVFMNSYIHHWLLKDAQLTDATELDDGEAIDLVEVSKEEVRQMINERRVDHPHVLAALMSLFKV